MNNHSSAQPFLPMAFSDVATNARTHPASAVNTAASAQRASRGSELPPYIKGHRRRLRERFSDLGPQAFADYELLESLLFLFNKRGDVKPLAHILLKEFGDLNHVICASSARLSQIKGVGQSTSLGLKLIEAICQRMLRTKLLSRPIISSWDALLAYCHATMAYRDKEVLSVLYLDNKNALIRDEVMMAGTVNHVPVYPREVAARALELNSMAIIIVHNHPSGDHTPSDNDIEMTKAIDRALSALNITLHDHIIISKSGETSFRALGYLQ